MHPVLVSACSSLLVHMNEHSQKVLLWPHMATPTGAEGICWWGLETSLGYTVSKLQQQKCYSMVTICSFYFLWHPLFLYFSQTYM